MSLPPLRFYQNLRGAPACPALPHFPISRVIILANTVPTLEQLHEASLYQLDAKRVCKMLMAWEFPRGDVVHTVAVDEPVALRATPHLEAGGEAVGLALSTVAVASKRLPTAAAHISSASPELELGAGWQPGRAQRRAERAPPPDAPAAAGPPLVLQSRGAGGYE